MAKKAAQEWITSAEAARILTENSGHAVAESYVRQLAIAGKLATKAIDKRTKLYLKSDVVGYKVRDRGTGEVRRTARQPRTSASPPKEDPEPETTPDWFAAQRAKFAQQEATS